MTDSGLPNVRVVVLNWNSAWLTTRCVRSIQRTDYPADRLDIVVVDNASIDGSLARLSADLDRVRFIANSDNLGFAEGNNRAMQDLDDCEFVALVNNDAVVDAQWLRPLVDVLRAQPDVGAAAPKMLLEAEFTDIQIIGPGTIAALSVDGSDVTRRCVFDGVVQTAHPTIPLEMVRSVPNRATISVPVGRDAREVVIDVVTSDDESLTLDPRSAGREISNADGRLTVGLTSTRTRRINSLGTELKRWTEGYERWFGVLDRPNVATHETWGFSGGGVLLRSAMLREVGLFDPKYFAYYEDTDLAWRSRRRGWRVMCVPESVVHHLHGGSAGPEAQGFFFLNYRNWLLTVLRNASPQQAVRAARVARQLSWAPFRRNVFGRVRRGQRPEMAITIAWTRVFAGVLALAGQTLSSRFRATRLGLRSTTAVHSRLMPATPPRPPKMRPGGPLIVYVDVTETLRSGWRAGIQRVVCELVRTIPAANPDIDLVPICWSKIHSQFRRVDTSEYESLLAPTATQQPAHRPAAPSAARRALATAMHRSGLAPFVYRARRRKELTSVPAAHRALLLERFEPGSVFLDIDASWNPTTQPRNDLLPALADAGVSIANLQYDLFPCTHPQWFIPQMVDVFDAHLGAHLTAGSLFLCISEHTRTTLVEHALRSGFAEPAAAVIPMGVTPLSPSTNWLPETDQEQSGGAPYLLTVGTIEPRKNHTVILDAFDKLRVDHPDAELIVVGRAGWNNGAVINRLSAGPQGVTWRTDVTDSELDHLYRNAHAVIVASITEGFGLPVIEALQRQVPVLSSYGGSLREAGGELVEYFDPMSASDLHQLMLRHFDDADHHRRRRSIAATYDPSGWDVTAVAVGAAIEALAQRRLS